MNEPLHLRTDLGIGLEVDLSLLDLAKLEAEEVGAGLDLAAAGPAMLDLLIELPHLGMKVGDLSGESLRPCIGIEDGALRSGMEEGLMFVLTMDLDEGSPELTHNPCCGGRAVDPGSIASPLGLHLTTEDEEVLLGGESELIEPSEEIRATCEIEDRLDDSALRPTPNEIPGGAFSEEESQATHDD
jgi:hypothetical protein